MALTTTAFPNSTATQSYANDHATSKGGKEYIRHITRGERPQLTTGTLINIVDHKGTQLMEFPLALFNAASTKKELVVNGKVTLPENYDTKQTKRLLTMMLMVPQHGCVCEFDKTDNTYIDLHFYSAAEYLGMDTFTRSIFDLYFKRVSSQIPAVANIEAIGLVRTSPGDKIFKQMSYRISVDYFEDKIANRLAFEAYLRTNERLRIAIEDVVARKEAASRREKNHEMHKAAFLERQRKREDYARVADEREERSKEWQRVTQEKLQACKIAEDLKEKKRAHQEIAVRTSMLVKKRTKQPMTLEEVRAHEKLFGKAVPF
ncbi:hypothetical protein BDU57DRAFT_568452 [Ampelomyces quisqualis]|uniref:Uncharacterized protein n=1 Tax=Ampelomyces quisqualis TaxID=50730 RepID=A0A6A5QXB8_AMPQU|nr:hypothetical protein BDU57DRAFT_568452 [Ampelomyces quisqualis]